MKPMSYEDERAAFLAARRAVRWSNLTDAYTLEEAQAAFVKGTLSLDRLEAEVERILRYEQ